MHSSLTPFRLISAASLSSLLLITGCSSEEPRAEISDAAEQTAQALSSGDFSELSLSSGSAQSLQEAVENLHEPFGDLAPEVTVEDYTVDEPAEDSVRAPTAEVRFAHTWDMEELGVDSDPWTYETQASYAYDQEENVWTLEGDSESILPGYSGYEAVQMRTTFGQRGRIMDVNGRAMVYNRDVVRIGIDKQLLSTTTSLSEENQREAAADLAEAVGINVEDYQEKVLAYGEQAFVDAITVRRDSEDITVADIEGLPGVTTIGEQMPLAESASFAPLLLGRVSEATAEHLENDPTLSAGDMVGTSGIQSQFDQVLRGSPGLTIEMGGQELYTAPAQDGEDVDASLHPRIQNLAQSIVGDQDVTSALVAIRPSDGAILAAASHTEETSYMDIATQATFAPGSTFKVVSGLAMLRDGLSPDSTVSCPNTTTVHGQEFGNVPGYSSDYIGNISFAQAMAASCNTLFADAYDDVTSEELAQAAHDLGINNEQPIGLPAIFGAVPDDSAQNLHAANLFGQGTVETSVLGMATVAASVGAGETVRPYLVVRDTEPQDSGITEEEASDLQELLRGTVEYGTLSSMDPVAGDPVYAKTGTAEAGDEDDSYAHTWVTAVQGDLAVAIFLEEGEFGGSTNGPLLHEFLTDAQRILAGD